MDKPVGKAHLITWECSCGKKGNSIFSQRCQKCRGQRWKVINKWHIDESFHFQTSK